MVNRRARVAVRIVREPARGELGEPIADARIGAALMDHAGEQRDLLGAKLGAFGREQRAFVPAEQPFGRNQKRGLPRVLAKLVVDVLRVGH